MEKERTVRARVDGKMSRRVDREMRRIDLTESAVVRRALRFYFAAVDHEINLEIADQLLEQGAFQ